MRLSSPLLFAALAFAREYRFVFFKVSGHRHIGDIVALGELELLDAAGGLLPVLSITNPGGLQPQGQTAEHLLDRNPQSKWIDQNFPRPAPGYLTGNTSILQMTLADEDQEVAGYRFFTANDNAHRDPVSWIFQRRDAADWADLHSIEDFLPPSEREVSYLHGSEAFWVVAPPPAPPRPEYRLLVTGTRDKASDAVQLSDVVLWTDDPAVAAPIFQTTNPGGRNPPNQGPFEATDRKNHTKWVDTNFATQSPPLSELRITLAADVAVHAYELFTANDASKRDPTSWTFEVRDSDGNWRVLSAKHAVSPPLKRMTSYGPPFGLLHWPPPSPPQVPAPPNPPPSPPRSPEPHPPPRPPRPPPAPPYHPTPSPPPPTLTKAGAAPPPFTLSPVSSGLSADSGGSSPLFVLLFTLIGAWLLCVCGCVACKKYGKCPTKVQVSLPRGFVLYIESKTPLPAETTAVPEQLGADILAGPLGESARILESEQNEPGAGDYTEYPDQAKERSRVSVLSGEKFKVMLSQSRTPSGSGDNAFQRSMRWLIREEDRHGLFSTHDGVVEDVDSTRLHDEDEPQVSPLVLQPLQDTAAAPEAQEVDEDRLPQEDPAESAPSRSTTDEIHAPKNPPDTLGV